MAARRMAASAECAGGFEEPRALRVRAEGREGVAARAAEADERSARERRRAVSYGRARGRLR